MCDALPAALPEYLTARRGCQDGKLVFVGIVKEQGDPRARLGKLDVPSDGALLARLRLVLRAVFLVAVGHAFVLHGRVVPAW